ncbi:hypothetical protein [Microbacterium sp. GbtcB4]|uniref:hypothetical protein n=1 Tax=Microbacterium sp. GbtcB4 TaxID=2824749 RepID=UPI001C3099D4
MTEKLGVAIWCRHTQRGFAVDFQMNPDFPRQMQEQLNKLKAVLDEVSSEYAGQDLEVVKTALRSRWRAVGNGADVTDPDLTNVATRISLGKRVWMENNGKIMSDD